MTIYMHWHPRREGRKCIFLLSIGNPTDRSQIDEAKLEGTRRNISHKNKDVIVGFVCINLD